MPDICFLSWGVWVIWSKCGTVPGIQDIWRVYHIQTFINVVTGTLHTSADILSYSNRHNCFYETSISGSCFVTVDSMKGICSGYLRNRTKTSTKYIQVIGENFDQFEINCYLSIVYLACHPILVKHHQTMIRLWLTRIEGALTSRDPCSVCMQEKCAAS